jgi:hypothetical protein
VTRPRAADDFETIRARMKKLRREREGAERGERDRGRASPGAGSTGLVSSRPPCAGRATRDGKLVSSYGRRPDAPHLGRSDPSRQAAIRSRRDRRLRRGEQIEDQLGALAETLHLDWSGHGEFHRNLFQHPR